jgi:5'-methylthioadenosine phosphorylase
MKEDIHPGDMVVPDQFLDRTKARPSTFFGDGFVAHVGFGDPVCPRMREVILKGSKKVGARTHDGGTYVCMEGPQFSTRAESLSYRALGVSVIGMTNIPEAKLAREAEICYATLALATDYDCWHESAETVSHGGVLEVMKKNVETARRIVKEVAHAIPERTCGCKDALKSAIATDPKVIPAKTREKLALLISHRLR